MHLEYAKALFSLTEENGSTELAVSELSSLNDALTAYPEYFNIQDTPAIPKEEKLKLAKEAFGFLSPSVANLTYLLCEGRRLYLLPKIYKAYVELYNEARGIVTATAVTAKPLTTENKIKLCKKLEEMLGKKVIIENKIDGSVLGGIKLRFLGKEMDASLDGRLKKLSDALKDSVV
jgi:F-type H+-transporting ATPase subunit delta